MVQIVGSADSEIRIPAGSFDDRGVGATNGGVSSEPIIEGNPGAPEDNFKPENKPVKGNDAEKLKSLHKDATAAKTELSDARKNLEERKAVLEEAKKARAEAKKAVKEAKQAMKSADSLEGAAFAWKRALVTQRQANDTYKKAVRSYNDAANFFNGKLSKCISVVKKYNKLRMKNMDAPKGMKEEILKKSKGAMADLKSSKASTISKFSKTVKVGGAIAIGAVVLGIATAAVASLFSSEDEYSVDDVDDREETVVADTANEDVAVETTPAAEDPESATVAGATSGENVEDIAPVEEQEAEVIDEASVDEEIAADEAETIYEVQQGDCLWNICKKELRDKNGEEPTGAQIIARIGEVMEKNGLHWESDNYHVMIYPKQKLNM